MTGAREAILGRIRALRSQINVDPDAIAREAAALLPAKGAMQPQFPELSNREKMIERLTSQRLTASVDQVDSWAGAVPAVRTYLDREGLARSVAAPPLARFSALDWGDISVDNTIAPDQTVAVGLADYGIAETGTLVFTSRPDSPTLFNFLGLHHVVLVEGDKILRYMEDYWRLVRSSGNQHPRNINFITGTSGTADIEAKNTRGAHGPRFLHVIIVGGERVGDAAPLEERN